MDTGAILFHCAQMGPLAQRICAIDPRIKLGNISWKRFEDGYPNIYIEKQRSIRRANVAFLASFDDMGDIFEQMSAIMALTRCGTQLFKIILPYFPTGTMERVDDEGQVATAKTLARFMSSTPVCGQGPAEIVLYDVHTLQQRFYFGDNIVPRLKSGTKYLKRELLKLTDDVAIVFPDFGAKKRFGKMFGDFEQIVCEKIRNGNERVVTIAEGEPRGKHCVIVDDIIKSGGTLIKCKDTLKSAGATAVSTYATHASCPKDSWQLFVDAGFANVWLSDSCPLTVEKVRGREPFRVLSLDESIARVILDEDELLGQNGQPVA
jgi:ribose-phosphate pyrophosphokinase